MIKKNTAIILVVIAAVALVVGVRFMMIATDKGPAANSAAQGKPAIGGPFALTDEQGRAVTDKTFAGKYKLIYFGYTFCPDVCPTNLGIMAQALDMLEPAELDKLRPLFVTVDPERDGVPEVREFTDAFHPAIIGLTGTTEQVRQMAKAYKVYYAKVEEGDDRPYLMDHSSMTFLMGPDGAFIRIFSHATPADKIVEALRKHL